MPSSTREQFETLAADHLVVPVVRELFAGEETPIGIFRKLALRAEGDPRPGTFLLESAAQGGIWSRYSFVGVASFGVLSEDEGAPVWLDYGLPAERAFGAAAGAPVVGTPLEAIATLTERWSTPKIPGMPPLTGGLVGFIGWEAVRQIERLPDAPPADFAVPGQAMSFVSELVVVDHQAGTVLLVATALTDEGAAGVGNDELWADAQRRLDSLQKRLSRPVEAYLAEVDLTVQAEPIARTERGDFLDSVVAAKQYIRDGDVFQVVISQRFELETTASALDVYRVLRALNPSPYMYLLALAAPDGSAYAVVGSSPEALVKIQERHVFTHPIAGSRPRGATPEDDQALADDLLADPKERAEHLMLVDLSRNDMLKVCQAGSVEVTEFMQVERFSHIMHLVSSVEGELRDDRNAVDVFRATFPAGTLSGAPKPRALEIIDELEPAQRGVYGGVVGYFDFAGDADLAIAIRTALISHGTARVQAGAGLVADSDPDTEFIESQNKAAAPLRAVAIANSLARVR
ncbi:anthranilate synthase component I [Naasia lichenicola]|uniref:Anthranilate synthase component 1 n=1 Tax=Naasia lichenicola TaxID=2565933 RepID=A0A4S4FS03_9MICO|nr:anthranilate synthase component I [Naasia lichenicola]THG33068.1 anthranilate synthase component I [Naasia lichenicola]